MNREEYEARKKNMKTEVHYEELTDYERLEIRFRRNPNAFFEELEKLLPDVLGAHVHQEYIEWIVDIEKLPFFDHAAWSAIGQQIYFKIPRS